MNTDKLFQAIRSYSKTLSQTQVDGINAILESCAKHMVNDSRHVAYIMATAYHESRFKPIEEIGKGAGKPYGKTPYWGRGYVQLTHKDNYVTFGHLLHIDLVSRPELALQIDVAAEIITIGMRDGLFTGVGLSRYFNATRTDAINARKIVNLLDKAALIAGYYDTFLKALI